MKYDKVIIGAGLYGFYAALFCGRRGENVLVLECEDSPFSRATYVNQARVHQGYHYPRSISTALKSAGYFERFVKEYEFCINKQFKKVYATSGEYSWTNGEQFKDFCMAAGIPCEEISPDRFFNKGTCDGAFLTQEYTYDAKLLRDYFITELEKYKNVKIKFGAKIVAIEKNQDYFMLRQEDKIEYKTGFILNATYAAVNQVLNMLEYETFKIKYELCEIILCDVSKQLSQYGFTVMDGPFFSIMPFGKTGLHSLTSVTFTPHKVCYEERPHFTCQDILNDNSICSVTKLGNCNTCKAKPSSAFPYMSAIARKYLKEEYGFNYRESLFSVKPILLSSEVDDSRPTVIKVHSCSPICVSVLSGKINTVYDLEEVLKDEN